MQAATVGQPFALNEIEDAAATPVDGRRRLGCGRTHSSLSSPSDVGVGPRPRNSDHGHCPLFTHPGAGLAFKVGEAMAVARVVAGGAAVAVAPMVMAVGSTDIVGTAGDTYAVPVAESPDPPATFCRLESAGCVRTNMNAAMIALPPSPAENHVRVVYALITSNSDRNSTHRLGRCLRREFQNRTRVLLRTPNSFLRRGLSTINRTENRLSGLEVDCQWANSSELQSPSTGAPFSSVNQPTSWGVTARVYV